MVHRSLISSPLVRRTLRASLLLSSLLAVAACDDEDDPVGPSGPFGRAIYGVETGNALVRFGSTRPDQLTRRAITGLPAGEAIVGIDFNAANRMLYALGSSSRLYTVDSVSGVATAVGATAFTPALVGTAFGFDFNPVPDRARVHANSEQNLRLNHLTGATAAVDVTIGYAAGDPGAGINPSVVGTAYTNSVSPAPAATVLFAIDAFRDVLVRLGNPNDGQLTSVGLLGVATSDAVGFDIAGSADGTAFASLDVGGTAGSSLYTINLTTGAATLVGKIGSAVPLLGIAIAP